MATVRHLGLIPDLCIIDKAQSPLFYEQEEIDEVGEENIYRPMTLRQMLALYWRVRKFKFTGYVEDFNEYQDGLTEEFILERQKDSVALSSERELVCFNGEWRTDTFFMDARLYDGFLVNSGTPRFEEINKLVGKIKKDNLTMLPTIYIDWNPANASASIASFRSIGINTTEIPNGYTKLSMGHLGEFVWPVYYNEQSGASFATMEITVEEWWEYDPGDGLGPIYDKNTGRQLRAFPDSSASAFAFAS